MQGRAADLLRRLTRPAMGAWRHHSRRQGRQPARRGDLASAAYGERDWIATWLPPPVAQTRTSPPAQLES
jgi:hypothetical protein